MSLEIGSSFMQVCECVHVEVHTDGAEVKLIAKVSHHFLMQELVSELLLTLPIINHLG